MLEESVHELVVKQLKRHQNTLEDKFIVCLSRATKNFPPLADRWGWRPPACWGGSCAGVGGCVHLPAPACGEGRGALSAPAAGDSPGGGQCPSAHRPCLLPRFMNSVLFLLPRFHGVMKTLCLEVVLCRAEETPDLYLQLKSKDFVQVMRHR